MRLADLPNHLKELLALQDILLCLGYEQDDLYIKPEPSGIWIAIKHIKKFYPIQATKTPPPHNEQFFPEWSRAIETWNASSQTERNELVNHSKIRLCVVDIIVWLSERKIVPQQQVQFVCPFCRGKAFLDASNYSLSHSEPACEKFYKLDVLEFAREARQSSEVN